jgi:hypothetical protein
VRVLSKLFRRLMLTKLAAAHAAGKLRFFGAHAHLTAAKAFAAFLAPLRKTRWFVYAKRPFAGPKTVLAYLSRYTHRVAISNRRLIALTMPNRSKVLRARRSMRVTITTSPGRGSGARGEVPAGRAARPWPSRGRCSG